MYLKDVFEKCIYKRLHICFARINLTLNNMPTVHITVRYDPKKSTKNKHFYNTKEISKCKLYNNCKLSKHCSIKSNVYVNNVL